MGISNLHTLEKLLTVGVDIQFDKNEVRRYPLEGILIPRIQRPYAQGRSDKNVHDIRRSFVENLLDTISDDEEHTLELSFIFGALKRIDFKDSKVDSQALELLDGQQRLTTLFLLHWYLYKKECPEQIPDWLSKFRYETRDSSMAFLYKITDKNNQLDLSANNGEETKPSEAIMRLKWFGNDFLCDTTVMSMLRMLDEIDAQYRVLEANGKTQQHSLHKNLGRLQFYIRLLVDFDMPDLLFIKMNSRGLPLTTFDNFKADILKYMEGVKAYDFPTYNINGSPAPFHFYFASQIDTKWIYLFWEGPSTPQKDEIIELDDIRTGARFFRFLNRILFSKLAIDYAETENPNEKEVLKKACEFFRTVPEVNMDKHLTDWITEYVPAIRRWDGRQDYFRQSTHLLNILSDNYRSGIRLRDAIRKSPFIATSNFEIFSKASDANGTFLYAHRAFLTIIIDFLLQLPSEKAIDSPMVKKNLRKLIRVLHNVIEHTEIEKTNILSFIKAFHEILLSFNLQSENFYSALSEYEGNFKWLKMEAVKAKDICRDKSFEAVMIRAEEHPILRGRLTPLYEPQRMTANQLSDRVTEFYRIFPVNNRDGICHGIADEYAKEDSHKLIRAMLSFLTDWETLGGTYITERGFVVYDGRPVNSRYLSDILFENGEGENLFRTYFADYFGNIDFEDFLDKIIDESCNRDIVNDGTSEIYYRLVMDPSSHKLYNWIKSREIARPDKEPAIRWIRDAGILNYDNTKYDRLVLTTTRRSVIPKIIDMTNSRLEDKNQKSHIEEFGEYFGYDVTITKEIKTQSGLEVVIKTTFYPNGSCKVCIHSPFTEIHSALNADRDKDESVWWSSYMEKSDVGKISKKINDWVDLIRRIKL
ncbi:MAG: DUF262 domain-containing protein [Muribaculaceae bacterium]|nr:DUF262 domain-containing protein [Muribaculaceae bacterium]